jgi:hypothetical protein
MSGKGLSTLFFGETLMQHIRGNYRRKSLFFIFFVFALSGFSAESQTQQNAVDPTTPGPYSVAVGEYKLPAAVDPDVLKSEVTEIWGKMYYPEFRASEKAPLIVLLHGNHGTCGIGSNPRYDNSCRYTYSGTCPEGYTVTPNHEGYDYLANHLASWGYWVVSINANRGITCGEGSNEDYGLILARGRLILKHLQLLHQWSTTGDAPLSIGLGKEGLIGQLDFGSVGLFGHSRGGEGIRAAYNFYKDEHSPWPEKIPGLTIKALFEVGATDGLSSRLLDAEGVVWNQLLPMCDGDVSDLSGRYPFERMLANDEKTAKAQKSLYEVWGANHNYFNTQWQTSDAWRCSFGAPIFDPDKSESLEQQNIAKASVFAFFQSHMGQKEDSGLNQLFNSLYPSPEVVTQITQVDREFSPTHNPEENLILERFEQETGTNSSGHLNRLSGIEMKHERLKRKQRAGYIVWQMAGKETYFNAVVAADGEGIDLSAFKTLDLRIARTRSNLNNATTTDFSIRLEDAAGNISELLPVSHYAVLNNKDNHDNPVFQTVRIRLTDFNTVDLSRIHAVHFIFDLTETGELYFANIEANGQIGLGGTFDKPQLPQVPAMPEKSIRAGMETMTVPAGLNSFKVIRVKKGLSSQSAIEIELSSTIPFPVMDSLPVLTIGKQQFTLSRYADPDGLKVMAFTLNNAQYKQLNLNDPVSLVYGKKWEFGILKNGIK